ncbi:hypothetical protein E3U55_10005 [Filobacillus milosensis]|uniref:DUF3899 domain-containing protein n=1 Tax=Filobacillus milosensis TaxID=94137 RepID=A0A4Y8IMM4_9BACI|nr:DUF5316 domain-containing protein [Filobacillus milosensis]TFB19490.1 hypothetical protein E3U55_10005 [Filobacillus milosensis]
MNIFFISGLVVALMAVFAGFVTTNWDITLVIALIAGIAPLFYAGLMSGAFVDGDRNRANYHTQDKNERESRYQLMKKLLLFASPNLITIALIFIVAFSMRS